MGYFVDPDAAGEGEEEDDLEIVDFDTSDIPLRGGEGVSPGMKEYFRGLEAETRRAYDIAEACRRKGLDPELTVEIPRAEDLAARVEALVGPPGVAPRIRVLSREMNREAVSLQVAKEVAAGRFGAWADQEEALDKAIRTGLAILTEGILVAPLEGIAGVRKVRNDDGTEAVAVSFAGPIRAAGGTGQALSVLIADVVRRELGLDRYKPTQAEIDRFKEEIPAYKRAQHLQYTPTPAEIDLIVRGCPIMVDGEGTEDEEVGGNRDLPRIETNRLRGGACLVVAEGLTLKAPKVQKHVKGLKLAGWEFIDQFLQKGQGEEKGGGMAADGRPIIEPNPKYLAELTAGRPILGYPSRPGGFRLRYGRARTGGLASTAIHPASMALADDFLAVGTQMKIERPGKATVATPCDEIDGPLALLHSGSLVEVTTAAQAVALRGKVKRIVDLGEVLVPFGEFAENNKALPEASDCPEWWAQEALGKLAALPDKEREAAASRLRPEVAAALGELAGWRAGKIRRPPGPPAFLEAFSDGSAAVRFAEATGGALHPRFNLFWHDAPPAALGRLSAFIEAQGRWAEGRLRLPRAALEQEGGKDTLVTLGALHEVVRAVEATGPEEIVVGRHGYPLLRGLGLDLRGSSIRRARPVPADASDGLAAANAAAGFVIRARAPCRVGMRMGRPEKAAERKMSPPVHVLFPLGQAGGMQRLVREAAAAAKAHKEGVVEVEAGVRQCASCRRRSVLPRCDREGCGGHTEPLESRDPKPAPQKIALAEMLERATAVLGGDRTPETVKGVLGLVSARKTPELLEKGLLRAHHEVYTFKDGTIRFDMTDVPLTHFRPREIHTPVGRLRELGYAADVDGAPLERDDQLLEIKVQDVVVSTSCMDYLLKTARFVDDELGRLFGVKPYYQARTREDLVGHLLVGLAPHTSGGVLARLVGHTSAQVGFAHPYFHAAKRRNCVRGDTEVVLAERRTDGSMRVVRRAIGPWVEKLIEGHLESARFVDAFGTESLDLAKVALGTSFEAVTLDPVTRQPRRVPVTRVLRGRTTTWIRFRTSGGRKFVCTPDHHLLTSEEGRWVVKVAEKLEVGDLVPVALDLPGAVGGGLRPPASRPTTTVNAFHGLEVVERVDYVESEGPTYCLDVETGSTDLATKNVLWGNGLYQIRCDGDEDCVMLLLDGLLNFSRAYLPQSRGGQMDAPLTLTLRIDPSEVDKEAHNVDVAWMYPLEFFAATRRHPSPKEVEGLLDTVAKRLGQPAQYEGLGFTHDTPDIAAGPAASAYKTIGDMMAKMEAQLELAAKIRAVDAPDVAARVIGSHFLPDMRGNLVAFSKQKVRCTKCNAKYRRIPIAGTCLKCGNSLTMTVHEGSVRKYLEVSKQICEKYGVDNYTRQRIEHIEDSIDSIFTNDKVKKAKLSDFF